MNIDEADLLLVIESVSQEKSGRLEHVRDH